MSIKKFIIQSLIIIFLSLSIGLIYNQILKNPLLIFKVYKKENNDTYFHMIDADILKNLLENDTIVLLDARTEQEFNKQHIPRAISFPISKFKEEYKKKAYLFEHDIIIITYCVDIYCDDSSMLAKKLYKNGKRKIFVYKGGIEEWVSLGNKVKTLNTLVN